MSLCIFFRWSSESKTKSHALSVRVIGKAVDVNRDYEDRKGSGGSWGTVDAHFLTFLTLAKINLLLVISFWFQISSHCHRKDDCIVVFIYIYYIYYIYTYIYTIYIYSNSVYPHLTEPTSSTLLRAGLEVSVAVQSGT